MERIETRSTSGSKSGSKCGRRIGHAVAALALAAGASSALAQRTVDFSGQTLGATPTAPGVVFSMFNATTLANIPWGSAGYIGGGIVSISSSSTPGNAVQSREQSAGFSPEGLRMTFTIPQSLVSFTVGVGEPSVNNATYRVRGFNSAGTMVFSRDYSVGQASTLNANTLVEVVPTAGQTVTRVDVLSLITASLVNGEYREVLDTLKYVGDSTAPVVTVTSPADESCVSPTSVALNGVSHEPDGVYANEIFDVAPTASGPWTVIASTNLFVPPPGGLLYNWNTSSLASGWYYLRLRTRNIDQLETVVVRRVFVDRAAPTAQLRSPAIGQVVGGNTCFDGSAGESPCGITNYTLAQRPASGGPFTTILTSTTPVTNDPLGNWNTTSLADGAYEVRLQVTDQFGNVSTQTRPVTVDNTPPVAIISNVVGCSMVRGDSPITIRGTVSDTNMGGWNLQYTTGTSLWTTISSGTSNIVNGVLGVLNPVGLAECAITLRLVAVDQSSVNCSSGTNRTEDQVSFNLDNPEVCSIDFNQDGLFPDDNDLLDFLRVLAGGECP
jgi:hypothetical protein